MAAAPAAPGDLAVIAKRWKEKRGSLIMALHDLQGRYGYVPREAALELGKQLNVPLARIYEVVTFYNYFKLEAPGRNIISVCMGTACYLKGAPEIVAKLSEKLGVKAGETTPDKQFHLQQVRCIGCCCLAPVVTVNEKVLAKVKAADVVDQVVACAKGA
jgi:NADH-quinone oxidoreductase subunit E